MRNCVLQVRPSQSVHESYTCWVLAQNDGIVLTGGCFCKAGNSSVCSHVSAVLYKISYAQSRGLCGEKCTDIQQTWNAGTSKNVTPSTICSTNLKRPKNNSKLEEYLQVKEYISTPATKKLKSTDDLLVFTKDSVLNHVFNITGSLFNELLTTPVTCNTQNGGMCLTYQSEPHSEHGFTPEGLPSCLPCRDVFEKLVQGSVLFYNNLSAITINQSTSPNPDSVLVWKIARKLRITASTASKVPKRKTTSPFNFMNNHLFGKFKGNLHTARGNYGEEEARRWYTNATGNEIRVTGTTISQTEPWLSASPDGLIGDNTIVEVKCPDPEKFSNYLAVRIRIIAVFQFLF